MTSEHEDHGAGGRTEGDQVSGWVRLAGRLRLPDAPALVSGPDGTVVRATEQAAELAGETSPDALLGRRLPELVASDDSGSWLRRPDSTPLVRAVSWPHGEDNRLHVTVLLDVSNAAATSAGPVTDEESSLKEVHRMAGLGAWEWDRTSDAPRLSEALQELTGQPSRIRTPFESYLATVHPDDRAWVRETWSPLAEQQQPIEVEHRYVLRDGAVRILCVHGKPTRDADGTIMLVGTAQDVTELRGAAEARDYRTTHDALTGLPNRVAINHLLERLLGWTGSNLAVLSCDIDNFKRIVTSLGHEVGEELLTALARQLREGLPDECTVARLSDTEFVIVCPDVTDIGGLDSLTRRVSGLLRAAVPVRDQLVHISGSIGVAVHQGSDGGEDLLRFADAAMGEAKQKGVNQVSQAGPELMASVDRQLHLEGQLRSAVHHDGLALHYQPVLYSDGSFFGAEALVRWPHPDHGLISPGTFLPVAERAGLLRDLDCWVLRTALREAADWPLSHGRQAIVGINLAGLAPGTPDFADIVTDALTESGIDGSRVMLELVETALVGLPSQTRHAMEQLVERGVCFAIDDFGTGYSSLARLKSLPVQFIKIAREFVTGVVDNALDLAVARAVVDVAHAMEGRCVAEGVETAPQLHTLSGLGVDYYQGWLFSPAVPAAEFRTLLAQDTLPVPT